MIEVRGEVIYAAWYRASILLANILPPCPQDSSVAIHWLVNYWKQSNPPLPGRRDNGDLQEPYHGLLKVLCYTPYAVGLIWPLTFVCCAADLFRMEDQLHRHWTKKSARLFQLESRMENRKRGGEKVNFQISMLKGWKQGEAYFSAQSLLLIWTQFLDASVS